MVQPAIGQEWSPSEDSLVPEGVAALPGRPSLNGPRPLGALDHQGWGKEGRGGQGEQEEAVEGVGGGQWGAGGVQLEHRLPSCLPLSWLA